jgi:hypothetical protein
VKEEMDAAAKTAQAAARSKSKLSAAKPAPQVGAAKPAETQKPAPQSPEPARPYRHIHFAAVRIADAVEVCLQADMN